MIKTIKDFGKEFEKRVWKKTGKNKEEIENEINNLMLVIQDQSYICIPEDVWEAHQAITKELVEELLDE